MQKNEECKITMSELLKDENFHIFVHFLEGITIEEKKKLAGCLIIDIAHKCCEMLYGYDRIDDEINKFIDKFVLNLANELKTSYNYAKEVYDEK